MFLSGKFLEVAKNETDERSNSVLVFYHAEPVSAVVERGIFRFRRRFTRSALTPTLTLYRQH